MPPAECSTDSGSRQNTGARGDDQQEDCRSENKHLPVETIVEAAGLGLRGMHLRKAKSSVMSLFFSMVGLPVRVRHLPQTGSR